VLRLLLDRGPRTRSDLARLLGLSQPAVTYITAQLLRDGLIEEGGPAAPAGGRGRHGVPLRLAPGARCAAAVHIGATGVDVGLVDLRAAPLAHATFRIDHGAWGADPAGLVAAAARQLRALLERAGISESLLLGAGVGVAGSVDGERGIVRRHAQLGWRDVPLASALGQALALPVVLDEHVRSMALAEAWFGQARQADSFAFLYVGAVLGCSVGVGRHVHRGHTAAAGEIGALPAWPLDAGGASEPGRSGGGEPPAATGGGQGGPGELRATSTSAGLAEAPPLPGPSGTPPFASQPSAAVTAGASLEATVSEPALLREARMLAERAPGSLVAWWVAANSAGRNRSSDALATRLAACGMADDPALALLQRRAVRLAPFIAHVVATYDPEVFVFSGPIAWDAVGVQLRLLREAVAAHAPALADRLPAFVPSAFGTRAALVGAAALVLQEVYLPPLASHQGHVAGSVAGAIRRRAGPPK
jgi:predicted NBD/HSP70 family sugar kinase